MKFLNKFMALELLFTIKKNYGIMEKIVVLLKTLWYYEKK